MRCGRIAFLVLCVGLLAGCGGSGSANKAADTANDAIYNAGYQLDGKVKCDETGSASKSAHRYACHAGVVDGGVTQQVTIIVQCVDGADVCTQIQT